MSADQFCFVPPVVPIPELGQLPVGVDGYKNGLLDKSLASTFLNKKTVLKQKHLCVVEYTGQQVPNVRPLE